MKELLAEYLHLLEAESLKAYEDHVVTTILNAGNDDEHEPAIPVRLSHRVSRFLIEPIPNYSTESIDGRLEYDKSKGRFVILLGSGRGCENAPRFTPLRQRFTYAHEVAHRFCFVKVRGDEWTRAVAEVCAKHSEVERLRNFRFLSGREEALCNNIAARVLVPDGAFEKSLAEYDFFSPAIRAAFGQILSRLASKFKVTHSCLLMRIQKSVEAGHLNFPAGFTILLIRQSAVKGSSRLGKNSLRVAIPIFPSKLGQQSLRRPFPGISADNFGSDIGRVLTGDKTQGSMRIPLSLFIKPVGSEYQRTTRVFDGRWITYGDKKLVDGGTALLWGTLN